MRPFASFASFAVPAVALVTVGNRTVLGLENPRLALYTYERFTPRSGRITPLKTQKAKAAVSRAPARRKAAPSAKAAKALKLSPEISAEEAAFLDDQLRRHEQSERAWQKLAGLPEEDDRWSQVEEHLLTQSQRPDPERRWKYFAK